MKDKAMKDKAMKQTDNGSNGNNGKNPFPAQLLTFRLGAREYGVEVEVVQDVIRPVPSIDPPAGSPVCLMGFIPIKGVAVPRIDLHRKLEQKSTGEAVDRRIISIWNGDFLFCFMSDDITGVLSCGQEHEFVEDDAQLLAGRVLCQGGRSLGFIDPAYLVEPEQVHQIRQVAGEIDLSRWQGDSALKKPKYEFERILLSLKESYERSVTSLPGTSQRNLEKYLVFYLNSRVFAIPIGFIREVVRPTHITPVPRTSSQVLGVINLRGEIISVTSLYEHLRMDRPRDMERPRLLVTRNTPFTTSIPVDGLEQVLEVKQEEISPAGNDEAYLGTVPVEGKPVPIIDLVTILKREIMEQTLRS